jgi:hypothetical protein
MSKELKEIFKTHQAEQNFGKYGMQRNTLESDLYLYCKQLESKLKEAKKEIAVEYLAKYWYENEYSKIDGQDHEKATNSRNRFNNWLKENELKNHE